MRRNWSCAAVPLPPVSRKLHGFTVTRSLTHTRSHARSGLSLLSMSGKIHPATRPWWPIALVLAPCMLTGQFCAAFVLPVSSTYSRADNKESTKAAVAAVDGRRYSRGNNQVSLRRTAESGICAARVDALDEEMVLAKFKRLQVCGVHRHTAFSPE